MSVASDVIYTIQKPYKMFSITYIGIQLVSATNHFKFEAPDGKQRTADIT